VAVKFGGIVFPKGFVSPAVSAMAKKAITLASAFTAIGAISKNQVADAS